MEMEKGMVVREKICSKPETHKDYIWEVVNNCAWLECEVKASYAVLLNKDGTRRWRERQNQTENDGIVEHWLHSLCEI